MKISDVSPDYVFTRLGALKNVDAVNFEQHKYIDLAGLTVAQVLALIKTPNVKFYQLDPDPEEPTE